MLSPLSSSPPILTLTAFCRYGSRALELLRRYYEGDLADVVGDADDSDEDGDGEDDDEAVAGANGKRSSAAAANGGEQMRAGANGGVAVPLQEEVVAPRGGLPPLLVCCTLTLTLTQTLTCRTTWLIVVTAGVCLELAYMPGLA